MKNENKKDVVKEALENIEVFEEQFRETGTFDKQEYHKDMDLIMDLVLYYRTITSDALSGLFTKLSRQKTTILCSLIQLKGT